MREEFTTKELELFESFEKELIIWMFGVTDKRYAIRETIKKAYLAGKKSARSKK